MKLMLMTCALATSSIAEGQGAVPEFVRYEFGIRVTENQVATNGVGGDLADLTVGTEGVIAFDVNPDASLFPSHRPGLYQAYQILDIGLSLGSVSAGGRSDIYPSTELFYTFIVENNRLDNGGTILRDQISILPVFDNTELGLATIAIVERQPNGTEPTLVSSVDLPLSLDPLLTTGVDGVFTSPRDGTSRVVYEVFEATITVIPTPASAALFAYVGLATTRRRR